MNIDLDSWEAGYAHGKQGRPPRCAIEFDQVSYLSGFCHGRAWRAQQSAVGVCQSRAFFKIFGHQRSFSQRMG
jgi:hypothetical protein